MTGKNIKEKNDEEKNDEEKNDKENKRPDLSRLENGPCWECSVDSGSC